MDIEIQNYCRIFKMDENIIIVLSENTKLYGVKFDKIKNFIKN